MNIVVTGARGFIGRNAVVQLRERGHEVMPISRTAAAEELDAALRRADAVCHFAGVNRPDDPAEFDSGNAGVTEDLAARLTSIGRPVRVLFASSVHVERGNRYGNSKLAAERALAAYGTTTGAPVHLFRLPHVIGKWCRPNYNSVVATFCHNIAHGVPIRVDDPSYPLTIVYIDDLIDTFERIIVGTEQAGLHPAVRPSYQTTVKELAATLASFRDGRRSLLTDRVGTGLTRVLYATYLSYLPTAEFRYPLTKHEDPRGVFVEMLKTPDCGQFSYFTAHPGITRGGHYHHSKTEKFLVLRGRARFRFRNIDTGERLEIETTGDSPEVVEMIPGWTHDITNVGDDEMVVMLWANEVFDRSRPDTFICPVEP